MATQNPSPDNADKTPKGPAADKQGAPVGDQKLAPAAKTETADTLAAAGKLTVPETNEDLPKGPSPSVDDKKLKKEYEGKFIRSNVGRMVDPLTGTSFEGAEPITYMNGWVESQIEAKKLEVCDPPETSPESEAP